MKTVEVRNRVLEFEMPEDFFKNSSVVTIFKEDNSVRMDQVFLLLGREAAGG